jgi:Phage holin T7 family, holin superfamily II
MSVTTETATTATTATATLAKLAPPVAIAGISLGGISLQDWVLYLTIAYTLLMITHKIWSMGVDWQWWGKNSKRKGRK